MPPARRKSAPRRKRYRFTRCRLDGDQILFANRVDERAVREFTRLVSMAKAAGRGGFTLNFEDIDRAFPEAMLQLIAAVDVFRAQRLSFDLLSPQNRRLNRVFLGANWAHWLSPTMFGAQKHTSGRHLAVQRYHDAEEQHVVVNEAMDRVLGQIHLDRPLITALEWSLNEITDNVLNHADASGGGLVQVSTFRDHHRIKIGVVDGGRGIPASMRGGHPHLRRDTDAIGEAMKEGVTRSDAVGQGNGLAGALRLATASGGSFTIVSARGQVKVINPTGTGYEHIANALPREERFHGTFVGIELRTDAVLDIEEALKIATLDSGWDYVQATYGSDGDEIILVVRDEAEGFGSRQAGARIRTKALNLLAAEPASRLVIDWTGVPSTSSSFADEFVGRMFVALGPTTYSDRVRTVGAESLVRRLLDKAIMQRVAQSR